MLIHPRARKRNTYGAMTALVCEGFLDWPATEAAAVPVNSTTHDGGEVNSVSAMPIPTPTLSTPLAVETKVEGTNTDLTDLTTDTAAVVHMPKWLTRFEDLVKWVPKGALVGLDLDDVLQNTEPIADCPPALLSVRGLHMVRDLVSTWRRARTATDEHKARLDTLFQQSSRKRLVEPNTAIIVRGWQDAGCQVFGITARPHSRLATETIQTLLKLGLDLTRTCPVRIPKDQPITCNKTESVWEHGVLFSDGRCKGAALDSLIDGFVMPLAEKDEHCIPPACVLVDDRYNNAYAMAQSCDGLRRLGVPVTSFLYRVGGVVSKVDAVQKLQPLDDVSEEAGLALDEMTEYTDEQLVQLATQYLKKEPAKEAVPS